MADANVPIKFEIYKGDQLVREEVLAQSPIKIGKLASSDLRLDDETVSRMHGVIEATGPDDVHVVDLGSTRGTTVNGERVTKARLQSGDEVMFGDCRVIVTFGDAMQAQATPRPAGVGLAAVRLRAPGGLRAAAAAAYAPPPQQQYAPPPATRRRQQQSYAPPSFAGAPGAGAEVEVHDGSRAMEVQTIFRGVVTGTRHLFNPEGKNTHGQGTSMLYAGLAAAVARARRRSSATAIDVGAEKARYEQWQAAGKDVEDLHLEGPLAGQRRASCSAACSAGLVAVVHGPQAARQDEPELPRRLRRRRRRAGVAGVRAVVVAPAGRRDRRRLRRQRHPAHDRRGVRRQPELPAAAVHPAARLQLLAAPGRLGAPRLRRDDVRRHRDAAPAHARRAVPDLALGRAGLHGRLGGRARPVPADDLLGPAGSEVAVARPLQLRQPLREVPHQAAGGEGRGHPRVAEVEEGRRAGRQGQAPQGRRRQDGQEDLQEQGGSLRPQGSEGQPGSAPRQEARRGAGQERRHPRRPQADRGLAHRLDLRPRLGARQRRGGRARRPDRQRRSARPTASAVSAWSAPARAAAARAKAPSASATSAPSARAAAAATARATAAAPAASVAVAPRRPTSSPVRRTCAARSTRRSSAASSGATSTR